MSNSGIGSLRQPRPMKPSGLDYLYDHSILVGELPQAKVRGMEQMCLQWANDCLTMRRLMIDDESRRTLARAIGAGVQRASLTLAKLSVVR